MIADKMMEMSKKEEEWIRYKKKRREREENESIGKVREKQRERRISKRGK